MIAKFAIVDQTEPDDSYCIDEDYILIGIFSDRKKADEVNIDFGNHNVVFKYIECETDKINGTTIGNSWYRE